MKKILIVLVSIAIIITAMIATHMMNQNKTIKKNKVDEIIKLSSDEDIALKDQIEQYLEENDIDTEMIAISYYDIDTKETYDLNNTVYFTAGSLYKVPLVMLYSEKIDKKEITLDTMLLYNEDDYEEGGPVGSDYAIGSMIQVKELLYDTIVYSDNTASRILFNNIGGWEEFRLEIRKYSSKNAYSPDFFDNSFTTEYTQEVLQYLYEHQENYQYVISDMKEANEGEYLKQFVDVEIAQKYGEIDACENAIGIVYGEHPYLISILTTLGEKGIQAIGDINKICYEYTNRT